MDLLLMTPSNLVLLHYGQARWNVLHLRDTLEATANTASAHLWVSTSFVDLCIFSFWYRGFLGLTEPFIG